MTRSPAMLAPGLALAAVLLLPAPSFAQFLDRWHEWGHGYGYGRSGFDIGKPGSAFSTPRWPSYYPYPFMDAYSGPPIIILNVYPPAPGYPAFYPPAVSDDRAHIMVHVPTNAQIDFDGRPTQQTGANRLFVTPPLAPGRAYTYQVLARWRENGRDRTEERTVQVHAGRTADVRFAP